MTIVVQAFRPAVSGRPKGLHYFRITNGNYGKERTRMRTPLALIVVLLSAAGSIAAQQPQSPASVPPGVPAPGAADAATIAAVMAFEKQCDDAAVKGDVA